MNSLTKIIFPICLGLVICLMPHDARGYTPEDCVNCHKQGSTESRLHISIEEFRASAHGEEATCLDCHTGVVDEAHEKTKGSGVADCSECHEQENRHGVQSKKGDLPRCHDCHTRHNILATDREDASVHQSRLTKTCRGCHPVECGKTGYLSWLPSIRISSHGKQDFSREYKKENCLGCHQGMAAHGETEPLNDMECYRCHAPRNGNAPLFGYIHPRADLNKQPTIFTAALFYQAFVVVLLWGGFRFFSRKFSGNTKPKG